MTTNIVQQADRSLRSRLIFSPAALIFSKGRHLSNMWPNL